MLPKRSRSKLFFKKRDGLEYPVIAVPAGVKTPVAARCDLFDGPRNKVIFEHTVYVRSLDANNAPSTTTARWQDWEGLVVRCMEIEDPTWAVSYNDI